MAQPDHHDVEPEYETWYETMPYGVIPPETLLERYKSGWFAMCLEAGHGGAEEKEMRWFNYDPRGVIPLDQFKIPHGSKALLKHHPYHITVDQDFEGVIRGCAALTTKPGRDGTWINDEIIQSYIGLHKQGHAHSVEVRDSNNQLVGGLYGVSIGGAFCGESMFSTVPGASKVALVELVAILKKAGYRLLDVQEVGPLTQQFGAVDISRADYEPQLAAALQQVPNPSEHFVQVAERIAKEAAARNEGRY